MHIHVHSGIYNSQKAETAQVVLGRWMDTRGVAFTSERILFGVQKGGHSDIRDDVEESQRHSAN